MHADPTPDWRRLSDLFDELVDLPPDARERVLAERAADPVMQQRLRALLAADEQADAGAFLGAPLQAVDAAAWEAWDDEAGYAPGSRAFGPYRLLRAIGSGGMGEVHLAERADGQFEQRVALKLLPRPTPGLLRRFRVERQILAHLEHPHIARLLDGGVGDAGVPYFAMEFIEGVAIDRYVAERELDVAATLQLFLAVCGAVQYAHRNLVVHRDIKPSNILVGADGEPKLLDFGIAKVIETTDEGGATVTHARAFTPDYAAPEQIRGEAVSTATDVYSLGVVLYELLSGQRPYRLRRDESLQQAILATDPVAPSAACRDARRARALRGDLDRIVLTALAKEPEQRYAGVDAFADDVRRLLAGRPVHARAGGAGYRARKFVRRHAIACAFGAGVALVLMGATWFSASQAQHARDQARLAAQQRDLYREEASHTQAVLHYLALVFGELEKAKDPSTSLRDALAHGADTLVKRLDDNPVEQAGIIRFVGELFAELDDDQAAEPLLRRFLDTDNARGNPVDAAEARVYLAQEELRLGNPKVAKEAIDRAQAYWQTEPDVYADRLLRSRIVEGQIEKALGDVDGAIHTYRDAVPQATAALGANHEITVMLGNSLALTLMQAGQLDEAAQRMDQVIAAYQSPQLRGDQGAALIALQNRGVIALRQGDYARAEATLRKAVDERRAKLGESGALASGEMNLGKTLLAEKRPADALATFNEALPMARKFSGDHSPLTMAVLQGRAESAIAVGDTAAATPLVVEARDVARTQFGETHPQYAAGLVLEARLEQRAGHGAAARAAVERAIAILDAAGTAGKASLADARALLAALPPG